MFGLQKKFEEFTHEIPVKFGVEFFKNRLKDENIFLSQKQEKYLINYIKNPEDKFQFNLSSRQQKNANISTQKEFDSIMKRVLNKVHLDIEALPNTLDNMFSSIIQNTSKDISKDMFKTLLNDSEEFYHYEQDQNENWKKHIQDVWYKPLISLQSFITLSKEAIEYHINSFTEPSTAIENVLIALHAKSQQIVLEISLLLENGYADGAEARWRTLHELNVIAMFISENNELTSEKYIHHEWVDRYKYIQLLDNDEINDSEKTLIKENYEFLKTKYGKNFKNEYGWASEVLNKERPTFRDIENSVELEHYRINYKSASSNVHANSFGLVNRLGLLNEVEENILLSGASESGLSIPANVTTMSMLQITVTLLTYKPNLDSLVLVEILSLFQKETSDLFDEVELELGKSIT